MGRELAEVCKVHGPKAVEAHQLLFFFYCKTFNLFGRARLPGLSVIIILLVDVDALDRCSDTVGSGCICRSTQRRKGVSGVRPQSVLRGGAIDVILSQVWHGGVEGEVELLG